MSRKHDMQVLAGAMISGIPFAARGENPEKVLPKETRLARLAVLLDERVQNGHKELG